MDRNIPTLVEFLSEGAPTVGSTFPLQTLPSTAVVQVGHNVSRDCCPTIGILNVACGATSDGLEFPVFCKPYNLLSPDPV